MTLKSQDLQDEVSRRSKTREYSQNHTSVMCATALVVTDDDTDNQPRIILLLEGSMRKHMTQAVYQGHDICCRLHK
jgi:hypothetical protein